MVRCHIPLWRAPLHCSTSPLPIPHTTLPWASLALHSMATHMLFSAFPQDCTHSPVQSRTTWGCSDCPVIYSPASSLCDTRLFYGYTLLLIAAACIGGRLLFRADGGHYGCSWIDSHRYNTPWSSKCTRMFQFSNNIHLMRWFGIFLHHIAGQH